MELTKEGVKSIRETMTIIFPPLGNSSEAL